MKVDSCRFGFSRHRVNLASIYSRILAEAGEHLGLSLLRPAQFRGCNEKLIQMYCLLKKLMGEQISEGKLDKIIKDNFPQAEVP